MGRKSELKDKFVEVDKLTGEEYEIGEYAARHVSSLISNRLPKIGVESLSFDDCFKKIHEVLETNSPIRLKKKSVLSFESTLTSEQLRLVQDFFNKYIVINPLTEKDMKKWLEGEKFDIRVKNIRYLSYLLSQLKLYDYICDDYGYVVVFNSTFLGNDSHELSEATIKSSASRMAKEMVKSTMQKRESLEYKRDIEILFAKLKSLKKR